MDRKKQVGAPVVGCGRPGLQRDEGVVGPGQHHLGAHAALHEFGKAQGDVENHIFFEDAVRAARAFIVAAMAGIDHDPVDFQPQRAGQRTGRVFRGAGGSIVMQHGYRRVVADRFRHRNRPRGIRRCRHRIRGPRRAQRSDQLRHIRQVGRPEQRRFESRRVRRNQNRAGTPYGSRRRITERRSGTGGCRGD